MGICICTYQFKTAGFDAIVDESQNSGDRIVINSDSENRNDQSKKNNQQTDRKTLIDVNDETQIEATQETVVKEGWLTYQKSQIFLQKNPFRKVYCQATSTQFKCYEKDLKAKAEQKPIFSLNLKKASHISILPQNIRTRQKITKFQIKLRKNQNKTLEAFSNRDNCLTCDDDNQQLIFISEDEKQGIGWVQCLSQHIKQRQNKRKQVFSKELKEKSS